MRGHVRKSEIRNVRFLLFCTVLLAFFTTACPAVLSAQDKTIPASSRSGALPPPPAVQPQPEAAKAQPPQTQSKQLETSQAAPDSAVQNPASHATPQPALSAEVSPAGVTPEQPSAVPQTEIADVKTPFGITCPPEYVPLIQRTTTALMSENFNFYPIKGMDPFVPFINLTISSTQVRLGPDDEEEEPVDPGKPLTPLQKMTLSEAEKGLKAITWGGLGRKALIEDSSGRGYIVAVGTPVGERNGVITQIENDRLIVQQQIWNRKEKKRSPQDYVLKLSKKAE